jgi:hypothetical protein
MIEIVSSEIAATSDPPLTIESPHATPAEAVAAALGVDPRAGLTSDEASRRASLAGPNELEPSPRTPLPPGRPSLGALVTDEDARPSALFRRFNEPARTT